MKVEHYEPQHCALCGEIFTSKRRGRPRKFCSRLCGNKASTMKFKYGISVEDYRALGDKCMICGSQVSGQNKHLDHDHKDDHVRGILCGGCNIGTGMFRDSPERLRSAAQYLERDAMRDA